ncbi:MAG: DUF1080 domain-containing protein [Acidobacteria bacterium]|nr:DUF1080 domain-containing protein [Acidobacteriota bacterium]
MRLLCTMALAAALAGMAGAQQAQRRGPNMPEPLVVNDNSGFTPIFDGTLKGWDGDQKFWRAENNTIVGETTAANKLERNTFLIWRGGEPKNFELKLEFKMNSTNSGIQYRSSMLPERGQWAMKGYQADIDFQNTYSGQIYEEQARGFLALRGQAAHVGSDGKKKVFAQIKDGNDLKGILKINDWNTLHIIARGNVLMQVVNGQLSSIVIDDDEAGRKLEGLIGLQIHVGPPMKVEFRNVWLKTLP